MVYSLVFLYDLELKFAAPDDSLASYRVEVADDLDSLDPESDPDALIASVCDQSLAQFGSLYAKADLPHRPLLVLISSSPIPNLPADLTLPAEWLALALPSALAQRRDNLAMQRRINDDIRRSESQVAAQRHTSEEVQLLKNTIVRTVSHELKTPLLHVKSAVSILAEACEPEQLKLVSYAMEATTRLETVIKNITQLAESLEIELQPMQVADSVAHAIRNLRRSWEHKENVHRIRVNVPSDLPLVLADEQGLGVALQLLLDNALKFSKKAVDLSAEVRDKQVYITVRDAGIGIERDKLEKIFDPFYQIDHTDARRFGGLGVGLAIVRLILERHQVVIAVESKPGKGSVFSFSLPVTDPLSSPSP